MNDEQESALVPASGQALELRLASCSRELERERRSKYELASALAEGHIRSPDRRVLDASATAADAVVLAQRRARRLRFAASAFISAAEQPPSAPAMDIYSMLNALDLLTIEYIGGLAGKTLSARAADLGLVWGEAGDGGGGGDETERQAFAYAGETLELEIYVSLAADRALAAGRSRVYFALCDGTGVLDAGIYVGHVEDGDSATDGSAA